MPTCTDCHVRVLTVTDRCPLCHRSLAEQQDKAARHTYPVERPLQKKSISLARLVSLSVICLILLSLSINWAAWNGWLWSVIFSTHVLYLWLVGWLTLKKGVHPGLKLMTNALSITLLLVVVNVLYRSNVTISCISWAVSYSMPIIFIGFITVIDMIMLRKKHNLRDFLLYQLSLCAIGFIPLVLVLTGVARPIYPSVIAAALAGLTILDCSSGRKKSSWRNWGENFTFDRQDEQISRDHGRCYDLAGCHSGFMQIKFEGLRLFATNPSIKQNRGAHGLAR